MEVVTVKVQKPMSVTLNEEPDTAFHNRYFEEFRGGTHLAMPKTICVPDSSSLKPGSGATEESWIRGCPDSWTITFGWTLGL